MKEGGLDKRYYEGRRHDEPDVKPPRHPSSQKFHDLCDAMKAMHDKKQKDYGRDNDPFANVRSTEEWGQPAWVGAMIRATDKMRRLQKVASGGTLANEGVEDSFMDLAVYAIIGMVLYQEQVGAPAPLRRENFEEGALENQVPGSILLERRLRGKFVVQPDDSVRWVMPATVRSPRHNKAPRA